MRDVLCGPSSVLIVSFPDLPGEFPDLTGEFPDLPGEFPDLPCESGNETRKLFSFLDYMQ